MEGFEVTPYFERRVMNDAERAHLVPYVAETVRAPDEALVQSDARHDIGATFRSCDTISV